MGDVTGIAWTDHTFNPWLGCSRISAGCQRCYAETFVTKRMKLPVWGQEAPRKRTTYANWRKPIVWNRQAALEGVRRRVFCASLSDVFEDHPSVGPWRNDLWHMIHVTPNLDWLLLTKRPQHMLTMVPLEWQAKWPSNVWAGTTIEDMRVADRADHLRQVPAAIRFISYEPALGPLDVLHLGGIHQVIYGGESGPDHRPHNPAWARAMRDKCRAAGVAFFYKQGNGRRPGMDAQLDGETIQEFPRDRSLVVSAAGATA